MINKLKKFRFNFSRCVICHWAPLNTCKNHEWGWVNHRAKSFHPSARPRRVVSVWLGQVKSTKYLSDRRSKIYDVKHLFLSFFNKSGVLGKRKTWNNQGFQTEPGAVDIYRLIHNFEFDFWFSILRIAWETFCTEQEPRISQENSWKTIEACQNSESF